MIIRLIAGTIPIALLALPVYYLFFKERFWRQSIPRKSGPPTTATTIEVFVLGLFAGILILHIATGGIGMVAKPLPSFVARDRTLVCLAMAGIAVCWLVLAARRSTPLATAGMTLSTVLGAIVLLATNALSYSRYADEIRKIPLPVEISIAEKISDVDVFVNNVRIGQAPLKTTLEEIKARAPSIEVSDEVYRSGWKNFSGGTFLPMQKIRFEGGRRVEIGEDQDDPADVFIRFERKGQPLLVSGSLSWSQGSRMFGMIQPARIAFNVMSEKWDRDVTQLIQQARLQDYEVSRDWSKAAAPLAAPIVMTIRGSLTSEPALQDLLDQWARNDYGIVGNLNPDQAWQIFERIREQADKSGEYDSGSVAGCAVEQLLDKLNPEQVVAAGEKRLAQMISSDAMTSGWSWRVQGGKRFFGTAAGFESATNTPADFVLAHALWRLDEKWDAQPSADNPVEARITPLLLRLSYRNSTTRSLAALLGGSAYDQFQQRRQRTVQGFDTRDPMKPTEWVEMQQVDKDFWEALNDPGPVGADFRRRRLEQIRGLADMLLAKSNLMGAELPKWTGFLFLEVEGSQSLAREFWPKFQAKVVGSASVWQKEGLQWSYLSRIRPLPEVAEFVAAFPGTSDGSAPFMNSELALSTLPDETKLRIALACLQKVQDKKSNTNPNQYSPIDQVVQQLNRFVAGIPLDAAAQATMAKLESKSHAAASIAGDLKQLATNGDLSNPMMERLAASPNAEHRRWVILQIRQRPSPANRAFLDRLLQDDHRDVRQDAENVAAELQALRQQPFPALD